MKRVSMKKTLGTLAVAVILFISVYAVMKDVTLVMGVLAQDMILALGLFGIKTVGGLQAKKIEEGRRDE